MPAYDFEIIDRQSGSVLEVVAVNLPIAKRDAVEFRRVTVPRRITVIGSAPDNPHDTSRIDMRNLNKAEERHGSNFDKVFGMSKEKMKQVWTAPEPPAPTKNQP